MCDMDYFAEEKDRLINSLRDIKILRIICKPWKDMQLRKWHKLYMQSGYSEEVKGLQNKYTGKRCFIIGNGPSLCAKDLESLENEYTFAANRIFEIFQETSWRPWSYVAMDEGFMDSDWENIISVPSKQKFFSYKALNNRSVSSQDIYWLFDLGNFPINRGNDLSAYISEDVSTGVSRGYTVTFTSIQLAIFMGFREIYLLGVDFNYSRVMNENGKVSEIGGVADYFNGKKYDTSCLHLSPVTHAYQVAKSYCDTHGIIIKNATRGGKLEVFERTTLEEIFGGGVQK